MTIIELGVGKEVTQSAVAKPVQTAPRTPVEVRPSFGTLNRSRSRVGMQPQGVNKSQKSEEIRHFANPPPKLTTSVESDPDSPLAT